MSDHLWVEKYRPKTIDDCILSEDIKETFKSFLKQEELLTKIKKNIHVSKL